ncbi:glucosamine inositolphosphorylceramide transferase family protein [Acetobacter sp.]|jgi:hypothetical protein|uniref:glucosamine inositolphosphorylceramide transferase family protein n=1 Tax=Acetobacter sp. TaxID=440 RepID=UPI0025C5265D|nr:hypothetical protein [Acetobacter sp.]MCH4092543.1 hypothetical protein [Acetobacter sp.]MCI1299677.1 hypothetical protein [Acetobacter sp.]MCI1315443.1 hypothetical protein [Acetobacter sp.]
MSIFRTDIWRVGVVLAGFSEICATGSLDPFAIRWLPNPGRYRFLADPFGIWRDDRLHVFVEHYDYRTRKGEIHLLILNRALEIIQQGTVLSEPWHLSYPFIFEADGEVWMLPEACRSGKLTLYRARHFPWEWEAVPEFRFPHAAIDASPIFTAGAWWMFYAPSSPDTDRMAALRLARADTLLGRWEDVSTQPLRRAPGSSRMGGTPRIMEGQLILPMQDCTETYGGAIRLLTAKTSPDQFMTFQESFRITAPQSAHPFTAGLHTLSAAGDVTLIDTKRILRNVTARACMDLRHHVGKWFGQRRSF